MGSRTADGRTVAACACVHTERTLLTLDTYSHLFPTLHAEAAATMDAMLGSG